MTRDEILKMLAGREMDALIETEVFKNEVRIEPEDIVNDTEVYFKKPRGDVLDRIPRYSTDIGAAWETIEKSLIKNVSKLWEFSTEYERGMRWEVDWPAKERGAPYYNSICGETAPLAICRAALIIAFGLYD